MTARRVYLITALSGIGLETAKLLASPESAFLLLGLQTDAPGLLEQDLRQNGSSVELMIADLTSPEIAQEAVARCLYAFGRLDAVFNVAGGSGRRFGDGPVHECTEQGWHHTLELNATTQYRVCREALRAMLAQAPDEQGLRGTFLNMSSVLAEQPDPAYFSAIAYAAAKGAVLAMTRAMAAYYAPHAIRVNAVAPGLTETLMSLRATTDETMAQHMRHRQPLLGRSLTAREVAETCAYLLRPESSAVTGQTIAVDAGWSFASPQ